MIYAFSGKKQSGKTTASAYLQEKLNATRINFKDALLVELQVKFPELFRELIKIYDQTAYDGWGWTARRLLNEKPPLVRALMQNYGTNVCRERNPDHWVDEWRKTVAQTVGTIVVDDVRFLNEAQAIRENGGTIIRIIREGLKSDDKHVSEQEMNSIEVDYTIRCAEGDLNCVYDKLDEIVTWTT